MPDDTTTQHRLSAEGADPLLFAGVNDANLQELQRTLGVRITFRGDADLLTDGQRRLLLLQLQRRQAAVGGIGIDSPVVGGDRRLSDAKLVLLLKRRRRAEQRHPVAQRRQLKFW